MDSRKPTVVDARGARGVQVGDHNTQHNAFHLAPRETAWPVRAGAVPPLVHCRQQRPADLDLDAALAADAGAVPAFVLSGLGGVGKTQLAAAAAHRRWDRGQVDLLIWVSATSRDSIQATYAAAAADVTGIVADDPAAGATRLLGWLAGSHGRSWLIILDDLADPSDLNGLWPPVTGHGRTVVTTRRRDHALTAGRHLLTVGLFTEAEAVGYLREKLAGSPDRAADAELLAADLGLLPLALSQAAAFMLDRGLGCAEYRRRVADRRMQLADLVPEPPALPDEHRATIAVTWSLSVELVDTFTPVGLAKPVLELAALVDPNAVPIAAFTVPAALTYLGRRRGHECDGDDVTDALHGLHRLNLVNLDAAAGTVGVHALVQRAVREATPGELRSGPAVTAADVLDAVWQAAEHDAALGQLLRASTAALHDNAGPLLWDRDAGVHPVLRTAGNSLGEVGLVADAVRYFRQLHAEARQHLGPQHPDILYTTGDLIRWRGTAGDVAGAAGGRSPTSTREDHVVGVEVVDVGAQRVAPVAGSSAKGEPDRIPCRPPHRAATEHVEHLRRSQAGRRRCVRSRRHRSRCAPRGGSRRWRAPMNRSAVPVKRRARWAKACARSSGPTTSMSASNRATAAARPGHDHDPRVSRQRPAPRSSTTPSRV